MDELPIEVLFQELAEKGVWSVMDVLAHALFQEVEVKLRSGLGLLLGLGLGLGPEEGLGLRLSLG
jgi:hypothetical protein